MFLIYVDESGKPNFRDPESFVLSAFIINERDWQRIDNEVKRIKIEYFPALRDVDVELHASDIVHRKNVFKTLGGNTSYKLLEDIYSLISRIDCTIIAVMIRKNKLRKRDLDLELWGFRLLFDRLCKFLEKKNRELISNGLSNEYGLLLIDSVEKSFDRKLRAKILSFLTTGTFYSTNKFLIEDPLFVVSQYRNISQLTDLVAYCIRRKHRNVPSSNSMTDKKFEKYYKKIYNKFDTDDSGRVEGCGIKIFP